ncbi:MAG: alpha-amylase family glycosyl hydrolase [Clostridium sp.]|nr:alpha-amylase family glycosyl hydrolase [Prevotella sp.]MCM1429504.1 alpha-amylase family glycosyl hydrolase [Clostridium sp.]MCM1476120.1 alpha-amylase family glycosyl hydrolase [Muribaculaceae bacterium]
MIRLKNLLASGLVMAGALCGSAQTWIGERSDFRDETIYFAITTRFYDGDHKNNVCGWDHQSVQKAHNDPDWRGDFKGLIDKLDYIKALGFTAIWITPVVQNCSGTDFHGYHAMDFSSVDLRYESRKEWGSSEDVKFQDLIDAAHAKGIKVVLDIVLNHTGNFGEAHFAQLFQRSQDIRNQASVSASLIPNATLLGADYDDVSGDEQYKRRFKYLKNTNGQNYDTHNYWHHVGTGWNWDYPTRWWGQIAGDCVDLNTENPAVAQYLVDCYGKFIEMGVDGFRIDTTGHISRLTFNKHFIPQFMALGEKYKDKRVGNSPFFMFGECCARYSEPTYRDQHNLSSYYYTWKSPQSMLDKWNDDASWWDKQVIYEGDDKPYGNMQLCLDEPSDAPTSENAFMKNGKWHEPDYSRYSGFSIIDFPMHYNFNNAGAAVSIAKKGDKYYNDASYNVVYVDSHDYCPGPNDGTRFNGGTEQWAENLSLMFTFRGIPCIYYGTEVEFQKGKRVDAGGTDTPVSESGRAYFGEYLEGEVTAQDFGQFTASGNVSQTLNSDLSQHLIRLNKIRMAVPALRKGQYTWDGCSAKGGYAFKRAYKESYALVAINGGATFSGVPQGEYTDVVTGKSYTVGATGTLSVEAPTNKGQLRVIVKDWKGGKIGEDGKFIYTTTAVSRGTRPVFTDPGVSEYYTAEDAVSRPGLTITPGSSSFKTETLTITATLNESALRGTLKVGDKPEITLTSGTPYTFTIGSDMSFNQSITVSWKVYGADNKEYIGSAVYTKKDPTAMLTVYYDNSRTKWSPMKVHYWGTEETTWPGVDMRLESGDIYSIILPEGTKGVVFNGGSSGTLQSQDIIDLIDGHLYLGIPGNPASVKDMGVYNLGSGIELTPKEEIEYEYFNLQGVRVREPLPGIYLRRQGNKIEKVIIR